MKANLILVGTVGLFCFTACSNGPGEEIQKNIANFETSWSEFTKQATEWSADLKTSMKEDEEHCGKMENEVSAMSDEKCKTICSSAYTACKSDKEKYAGMWKDWETMKSEIENLQTQFAAWKDKVMKGGIDKSETQKSLGEWYEKKSTMESKLSEWSNAIITYKSDCQKHMLSCIDACNSIMESMSKNQDKGKSKKG
ncbi:MAG: hypothetical protein HY063_05130 [Bacteroidetes bacterium]|nr:hypothetical protein [Bacteroidota bacterium]